MLRRRRTLAAILALLLAVWWLSGLVVVRSLSRRPHPQRDEPLPVNPRLPVSAHHLTTPAGETFGAWWFEGDPERAVILLLHANGGSRSSLVQRAMNLQRRGRAVLAPTLHAHGDASGELNDFGHTARLQVPVCLDLISELAPGRPVVVDGLSLGAATAILAAGEVGARAAGYVLESPFRDLASAARNRLATQLAAPLDSIAYLAMRAAAPLYFDPAAISPLRAMAAMPRELPALFLVGSEDGRAPLDQVRELVAAHGPNSELVVFRGAGHDNLAGHSPELFWSSLERFLAAVESGTGARAGAR